MANRHTTKAPTTKDTDRKVTRLVKTWLAHRGNMLMTVPKDIAELAGVGAGSELMVIGTKDGFTVTKIGQ